MKEERESGLIIICRREFFFISYGLKIRPRVRQLHRLNQELEAFKEEFMSMNVLVTTPGLFSATIQERES
jgi:hypothetical protein